MPKITGPLKYVTDRASEITEVWVRARELRTHDGGVVTASNDRVPVTGGQVSFGALPGPAVLGLIELGRPVETVPIIVGDAPNQSLETVVRAAEVATTAQSKVLEDLAIQVAQDAEAARADRVAAEDARDKAKDSASSAATSATASAEGKELILDAAAASVAAAQQIANLGVSVDLRIDTTVGTRVFAGSTMIFGDTGWRDLTGLVKNGWEVEVIRIIRIGRMVALELRGVKSNAITDNEMTNALPVGFRPTNDSLVIGDKLEMMPTGIVRAVLNAKPNPPLNGWPAPYRRAHFSWVTDQPWPTSLPGNPA